MGVGRQGRDGGGEAQGRWVEYSPEDPSDHNHNHNRAAGRGLGADGGGGSPDPGLAVSELREGRGHPPGEEDVGLRDSQNKGQNHAAGAGGRAGRDVESEAYADAVAAAQRYMQQALGPAASKGELGCLTAVSEQCRNCCMFLVV